MRLEIDIPEETYKKIKKDHIGAYDFRSLMTAIKTGIPLFDDLLMEWTPCNVALPEKSDLYLVTWRGRYGSLEPHNWIELIEYTAADGDRKEAYGWETYELEKRYKDVEVLAWMEAPVEYKETKK